MKDLSPTRAHWIFNHKHDMQELIVGLIWGILIGANIPSILRMFRKPDVTEIKFYIDTKEQKVTLLSRETLENNN